jgi:predicted alpha/beta-fold hydrolase
LALLSEDLTRDGLTAVGYSLGGAMLLKYLGEEGTGTPLRAAATVSAPIDLRATCCNMLRPRNRIYHRYLLNTMKEEATGEGAVLTAAERAAILGSHTVWEYDDVFIAPRHGFAGVEDYYERCKPVRFMGGVRIPTLVLASADDPWIPHAPYHGYNWAANNALLPMLTRRGGHVGFHGIGSRQPWSDTTIARFLGYV